MRCVVSASSSLLAALLATYALFYEYLPPFKRVQLWSDVASYHYPLQSYAFQALKKGASRSGTRHLLWHLIHRHMQAALLYPPTWLMYAAVWDPAENSVKAWTIHILHVWMAVPAVTCGCGAESGNWPAFRTAAFAGRDTAVRCVAFRRCGRHDMEPLALWGAMSQSIGAIGVLCGNPPCIGLSVPGGLSSGLEL